MNFKHTLIATMIALAPMSAMAAGSLDVFYVNQDIDIKAGGGSQDDDGDGFGIRGQAELGQNLSLTASFQDADMDDADSSLKETRIGLSYDTQASGINVGVGAEYVNADIDIGPADLSQDGYSVNVHAGLTLIENLSVYGKIAYTDLGDLNGAEYTAGAIFAVNKQVGVFAEYRLADLDGKLGGTKVDIDLDTVRVGVRYTF